MSKTHTGNEGWRDSSNRPIYGLITTNTLLQQAITVTTSPTPLPTTALSERISLIIINLGSAEIYIGNSSVSTSDGFPIYPRGVLSLYVEPDVAVYAIAASNQSVRILEGS